MQVTVGLEVSRYWIEFVYQVLRKEMCVCVCVCVCVCCRTAGRMDVKPNRTLCVGVCVSEGSWQDGCETKQDPVGLLGIEAFLCLLLLACR